MAFRRLRHTDKVESRSEAIGASPLACDNWRQPCSILLPDVIRRDWTAILGRGTHRGRTPWELNLNSVPSQQSMRSTC
jgi:hypothetical protein